MEQQNAYQLTENLLRSASPLSQQHSNRDSRTELISKRSSSPMADRLTPPPPPLVSPLSSNAITFQTSRSPQESDSTFYNYIDRHFQQDAHVLKAHLSDSKPNSQDNSNTTGSMDKEKQLIGYEPNTLWAALKTDLDRFQGKGGSSWADCDQQKVRPWWVGYHDDGASSMGAVLFMFGFIFPPLWWLGAFWPRRPEQGGKMAARWQQLNRYFSIGFSIILGTVIIVVAALYATHIS
ncbi:unnamed protein product [Absidia cylindrospora]